MLKVAGRPDQNGPNCQRIPVVPGGQEARGHGAGLTRLNMQKGCLCQKLCGSVFLECLGKCVSGEIWMCNESHCLEQLLNCTADRHLDSCLLSIIS